MPTGYDLMYKYTLTMTYQAQTMQNVLWFRNKTNSPQSTIDGEMNQLIGEVNSWFTLNLQAWANNGLQFINAVLTAMNGPQPYQVLQNYTNMYGAISGEGMPPHDAVVLSLYTPFHGRRLHGRLYIPAISESDQNGGIITDAAMVRAVKIGTDLLTRYGQSGTSAYAYLTVFSRKNGVTRSPGPPPTLIYNSLAGIPVSRILVNNLVRTQRHRRRH